MNRKLVESIIATGHRLERIWPLNQDASVDENADANVRELRTQLLVELRSLIAECASESPDLSRLAVYAQQLPGDMSAKHLSAILVPFERLLHRGIREDEFLIDEGDGQLRRLASKHGSLIVVLDNIRSSFNVGSVLRTAEGFAVEKVILSGYTPTPEDDGTRRSALGAEKKIAWSSVSKAESVLSELKQVGFRVVALETSRMATSLADFVWPEKAVLLLGNERFGLDHEVLRSADHLVQIPMYGEKNSLNVAVAFGIAAADWRAKAEMSASTFNESGVTEAKTIRPIGRFKTKQVYPFEATRQANLSRSDELGVVELSPEFAENGALNSLESFNRIWLIYGFHHNHDWKPLVLPPRGPYLKRGVFATRAPYRPNQLGLSAVELIRIEGNRLFVRGFDLLDATPIYDIKPYLRYADALNEASDGWLTGIDELSPRFDVIIEEPAARQLAWLEERDIARFASFLVVQLEFEPCDEKRKRVSPLPNGFWRIAYRTWRADFAISSRDQKIFIKQILSGYSATDLSTAEDPYGDKALHRDFQAFCKS